MNASNKSDNLYEVNSVLNFTYNDVSRTVLVKSDNGKMFAGLEVTDGCAYKNFIKSKCVNLIKADTIFIPADKADAVLENNLFRTFSAQYGYRYQEIVFANPGYIVILKPKHLGKIEVDVNMGRITISSISGNKIELGLSTNRDSLSLSINGVYQYRIYTHKELQEVLAKF